MKPRSSFPPSPSTVRLSNQVEGKKPPHRPPRVPSSMLKKKFKSRERYKIPIEKVQAGKLKCKNFTL